MCYDEIHPDNYYGCHLKLPTSVVAMIHRQTVSRKTQHEPLALLNLHKEILKINRSFKINTTQVNCNILLLILAACSVQSSHDPRLSKVKVSNRSAKQNMLSSQISRDNLHPKPELHPSSSSSLSSCVGSPLHSPAPEPFLRVYLSRIAGIAISFPAACIRWGNHRPPLGHAACTAPAHRHSRSS
jgi:hypothetical protein